VPVRTGSPTSVSVLIAAAGIFADAVRDPEWMHAVALLVDMRLRELPPSRLPFLESRAPDLDGCRVSADWTWRL
jgi:hypothetical protein